MQQQVEWARGRPDEHLAYDWQTSAAAFAGQWRKAQELSRRAIDLTAHGDTQEIAAQYATEQALRGAIFGTCPPTKALVEQGLKLARSRVALSRAALALALCNEVRPVQPLVNEMTQRYPEDTMLNSLWLPAIRAALSLHRGDATQALEQLQATTRYEAAAEFWPQYLRGQAYLQLKQSAKAAAEFQQILDHRGQAPLSVLYPLAQLGLARAAKLNGDVAKANKAYEDFLALWKEADQDVPIWKETRQENMRVK